MNHFSEFIKSPDLKNGDARKYWILCTVLLVVLAVLITHVVENKIQFSRRGTPPEIHSGGWGDLQTWDIRLEQPLEYAGFEQLENKRPQWHFGTLLPDQVTQLLVSCGVAREIALRLLKENALSNVPVVLQPDESTVLALSPEVRSRLYRELANDPANRFHAAPTVIPEKGVEALFDGKNEIDAKLIPLVSSLCYQRNGFTYFSDPEIVFSRLKSDLERLEFKQSIASEQVVAARLLIRRNADIDKPLNYWALSMPHVALKDLRPLFEAQQSLKDGGSLSILFLLPPLAREKLFTTPSPEEMNQLKMPDCHWTALNFFSSAPDPRMSDTEYASKYISDHYYQIAKPGIPGDLVLLLNTHNRVIHSSVYLADDLVFTKNGISFSQPWVIMHEKSMVANFSALDPVQVAYFRNKGE